MIQSAFNFDPSARKHKGAPTSVAAHRRIAHTKQDSYKWIMDLLTARGEFGATSKEIAASKGIDLHKVSGRLSELKAMGWIEENGSRRDGAAVLVVKARA